MIIVDYSIMFELWVYSRDKIGTNKDEHKVYDIKKDN